MHLKYHTEGFVLDGRDLGERGKMLTLLTRDFGLVRAQAVGLRDRRSKLRFSLTDYSYSSLSLVKTRPGWRITGAASQENLYFNLPPPARIFCANLFNLIKKLLPPDVVSREIFETVSAAVRLPATSRLTAAQLKSLECLTVLRILWRLGYLGPSQWREFLEPGRLSLRQLDDFLPRRAKAVRAINRSLKASQLI